jgi:hypothetical protein
MVDFPEDDDSENSIGTDMSSSDWGGDDERDFAEEAANEAHVMAEHEETDEPEIIPPERGPLAPPKGRLFMVYTDSDDTVLRAAINAEDDEKAVEYFRIWRNQGVRAVVLASAPSPR